MRFFFFPGPSSSTFPLSLKCCHSCSPNSRRENGRVLPPCSKMKKGEGQQGADGYCLTLPPFFPSSSRCFCVANNNSATDDGCVVVHLLTSLSFFLSLFSLDLLFSYVCFFASPFFTLLQRTSCEYEPQLLFDHSCVFLLFFL